MSGTVTIGKIRLADEYVSDQIDAIEQEQLAVSGRMTAVEQAVATLDSVAVSNRVTTAEQDIDALEEEDIVLAIATTAVSNRLTTAEQDIAALEAGDVALASATTAVSTRVTTVEQDIAALETQDNVLASATTTLASATTAVSNRVTAAENRIDTVQQIADGLISVHALLTTTVNRVAEIETYYVDSRERVNIKNRLQQKYFSSDGGLSSTTKSSDHVDYFVELDQPIIPISSTPIPLSLPDWD